MNAQPCSRLWQVEAERDGRLAGKDRASARRHRETCAECSAEDQRLAQLTAQMAQLPAQPLDDVSAQRVRQNLLAAFNESVLEPAPASTPRRFALPLAFGLCAAAGMFYFWVGRPVPPAPAPTSPSSVVDVHASAGARFSDHVEQSIERVQILDGSASLTVHPHPNRRVLITLPDGEIEDLGTIFEVRVEGARTQQISVTDGRIAVRLRERAPFALGQGESWQLAPAPNAVSEAPSARVMSSPAPSAPSASASPHGAPRAVAHPPPAASAAPSATPSTEPDTASSAEDDAYLAIIDALRRGKNAEAHARAKSYLLRFPNGFRRVEVLNIATREADGGSG